MITMQYVCYAKHVILMVIFEYIQALLSCAILSSMQFGHYDLISFIFFVNINITLIKIILELIKFYK